MRDMTPQEIRGRAADEVVKATPNATLSDVQNQAAAKAKAFLHWLQTGEVQPVTPPAKPPG